MRLEIVCLTLLSVYSLLSLSINSWFHNVNDVYNGTTDPDKNVQLFTNSFQASFAFDILIFVWSLFGFLIARKSLKYLCYFFCFYLLLLCIGKLVSTSIFLGNGDVQGINNEFKDQYNSFKNNNQSVPKEFTSWKASYENMYASVILELLLSGITCFFLITGAVSPQIQKTAN
jgi:hypothetical protein